MQHSIQDMLDLVIMANYCSIDCGITYTLVLMVSGMAVCLSMMRSSSLNFRDSGKKQGQIKLTERNQKVTKLSSLV